MRVNTIRIPCSALKLAAASYSVLLGRTKLEDAGDLEAGRYLGFSIEVSDIARLYRDLEDRIAFVGPPEKQPWGGTMAHVEDTSGNSLSIVEAAHA
jgi:predicted enzyme related to lactoylglutathione lyase